MTSTEEELETSSESSRLRPLGSILVGLIFLLGGTVFFRIPTAIKSYAWPTVEGTIVSSEVTTTPMDEYFCAEVRYQYIVNGAEYVSSKTEVQDICINSSNVAKSTVSRYPAGKIVEVYYDPNNQTFAVLEPGLPVHNYIEIILMIFTFGMGVLFVHQGLIQSYSHVRKRG